MFLSTSIFFAAVPRLSAVTSAHVFRPDVQLDDWALVDKYCPLKNSKIYPLKDGLNRKFYIYRDHWTYSNAITQAFESVQGSSGQRRRRDLEIESEFWGEIELFCELFKHPSRTWDQDEASLFIVPAFPTLVPNSTAHIAEQLLREPSWQLSRGSNHVVVCTHWACASRLGELFKAVALPGWVGALERNAKWLDPRIYRVDIDNDWEMTGPALLDSAVDHVLCPERVVVLPYPAHLGIVECRHQRNMHESVGLQPAKRSAVSLFYAGALRIKHCGLTPAGAIISRDPSHGVRPALTANALQSAFGSEAKMRKYLDTRGYIIDNMPSETNGGRRIGSVRGYPLMIQKAHFCLHLRGDTPTSRRLYDAIAAGCLPIVVSDDLGTALPFTLGGEVNYSAWVTVIPETAFVGDPLGAIDAIIDRLLIWAPLPNDHDLSSSSRHSAAVSGAWIARPEAEEMRAAMALDAPKITLCSGEGAVGDQFIRELFIRSSLRNVYGARFERPTRVSNPCIAANEENNRPLYSFSANGRPDATKWSESKASWLTEAEARLGTNWTWCSEEKTVFSDYSGKIASRKFFSPLLPDGLSNGEIVHVS